MRFLICGGRDFKSKAYLFGVLDALHEIYVIDEICHGDCPTGADHFAGEWAKFRNIPCQEYPANWKRDYLGAGPIRNRFMYQTFMPDKVVAFPGGKGTADMISVAHRDGCEVIRFGVANG